jgi:RIO-like serine/threonine protein kinase
VVIRTDTADFKILKAIADLKIPYPKADKINSLANLDPEELGARLGVLEMEGYVKTKSQAEMEDSSLPNCISAAGLTTQGKRALAGPRW